MHAQRRTFKIQNIKNKQKRRRKTQKLQLPYMTLRTEYYATFWWFGEDNAHTYLHYIPAHPDHKCEKDALVRRQRGPEGSYPSLSGRRGDQVD